ncbi:hypothetical protein [Labrys sp. 22185]|uniref:hypothetical protein n=1 Tax=Labrys sp. 22185 TaxID=3453888 RepID=UPI003F859A4F
MQMKSLFLAAALMLGFLCPALAQVPVSDAKRLSDETGIANCMAKARAATDSTVQPEQQIHGSVSTPGNAGQSGQVGSANVTGSAGGSYTIPAVGNIGNNGVVNGIDFGSVLQVAGSIESLKGRNVVQAVAAAAAIASALQQNNSNWQASSSAIGSANGIQAAFDQNSGTRVGTGAAWNQAVQTGNGWLALQNQRLMDQTAASAAQAQVMTYDQAKAGFVAPKSSAPDNQQTVDKGQTTYGNVAGNLNTIQSAAQAGDVDTGSIAGQ